MPPNERERGHSCRPAKVVPREQARSSSPSFSSFFFIYSFHLSFSQFFSLSLSSPLSLSVAPYTYEPLLYEIKTPYVHLKLSFMIFPFAGALLTSEYLKAFSGDLIFKRRDARGTECHITNLLFIYYKIVVKNSIYRKKWNIYVIKYNIASSCIL